MRKSPIRCVIVDDEDPARALLAKYIERVDYLELVASLSNPLELYPILREEKVDLLFLDIQMPQIKGTDLFGTLDPKPQVVFTTAYSEYALESYDLQAADYLLKPIRFERFMKAVQRIEQLLPQAEQEASDSTLVIKSGYDLHRVPLESILYIEGMKEYVAFHTAERRIMSLQSLKSLEGQLPPNQFMRVHRSYIVQKQHVASMVNRKIIIRDREIPIGESYWERVQEQLF